VVSDPRDGTNFETELVGVLPNGQLDPLVGFFWASDYSGESGEVYKYDSSVFDDGGGSGGVAILGETYFLSNTVPEPSTWAMMLIGFMGLGYAGYRRARATQSFAA
jgi:hypothetical protein